MRGESNYYPDPAWRWVSACLIGIVCLGFGILAGIEEHQYQTSAKKATAHRAETWVRPTKNGSYSVNYFEFMVDGKAYGSELGEDSEQEITVEYLPGNPEHFRRVGQTWLPTGPIAIGLGLVSLIVGIFLFSKNDNLLLD